MKLSRRDMLSRIGVSVPAVAIAVMPRITASDQDRFTLGDWRVQWSGWKDVPNQFISLGYWLASRDGDPQWRYSCVGGQCGETKELYLLDTTIRTDKGYRPVTILSTESDRAEMKAKSRALLISSFRWS